MTDTAVLIPTLRRPHSLVRAVISLFGEATLTTRLREIVVIDNDPLASAEAAMASLRPKAPVPLVYVREPRPGVATARNAGLCGTDAPLIAFLDDDETARPGWLAALLGAQARFDADVVFGPIRAVLPDDVTAHRAYLEQFFSRLGPEESGLIAEPYGCGGSLMKRETALPGPAPFDPACDETGGEDDVLFSRLIAQGGRLAWAVDALAYEHVPPDRATLAYALRRAFAYGQSPSQICARRGDWAGAGKWMAVGAAQTLAWSALALPAWALQRPGRAEPLDRAARGLGKLFWGPRFEPRFYGSAGLARMAAAN
jgi:hypothetical protein